MLPWLAPSGRAGLRPAIFLLAGLLFIAGCPGRTPVAAIAQAPTAIEAEGFRTLTPPEKALVVAASTEGSARVDGAQPPQVVAVQSLHAAPISVPVLARLAQLPDGEATSFEAANALRGLLLSPEGREALIALFPSLPERRREWAVALIGRDGTARHLPLLEQASRDESPKVRARAKRAEKALLARAEGGAR